MDPQVYTITEVNNAALLKSLLEIMQEFRDQGDLANRTIVQNKIMEIVSKL